MTKPSEIVANTAMTAAEPRFVAPELVDTSGGSPKLIAGKCKGCDALSFPKAPVCPECLGQEIAAASLSTEGRLYSRAVVHQAPKGWAVPYTLGYVDLPEGVRVLAHIQGDARIDAAVKLGTGQVGTDAGGTPLMSYVFVPANGGKS